MSAEYNYRGNWQKNTFYAKNDIVMHWIGWPGDLLKTYQSFVCLEDSLSEEVTNREVWMPLVNLKTKEDIKDKIKKLIEML